MQVLGGVHTLSHRSVIAPCNLSHRGEFTSKGHGVVFPPGLLLRSSAEHTRTGCPNAPVLLPTKLTHHCGRQPGTHARRCRGSL